ncbi:MAG: hypothetical protein WDN45_08825 [Caulobacteraceae bacterium]
MDEFGEGPPVFEHVTLLLSFVYAVALTHLLSTATELLIARRRVRPSGLYAAWLLIALLLLLVNWMAFWGLVALKRWTVPEVIIQFSLAIAQYFTCSAFRIAEAHGDEAIDLSAIYQERRTLIAGAFLALGFLASFENWWDRNNILGFKAADWIGEDLAIAPMVVGVMIAGWARPLWLQWAAAALMFGSELYFLATYAIPAT